MSEIVVRYAANPLAPQFIDFELPIGASINDAAQRMTGTETFPFPTLVQVNGSVYRRERWHEPLPAGAEVTAAVVAAGGGGGDGVTGYGKAGDTSALMLIAGAALVVSSGGSNPMGWGLLLGGVLSGASVFIKPSLPEAAEAVRSSPTYQRGAGNRGRVGQAVPVRYGRHRCTPDLACPQWVEWVADNGKPVKFFNALLCLGAGRYDIEQVYLGDQVAGDIGDSSIAIYQPGAVEGISRDQQISGDVDALPLWGQGEAGAAWNLTIKPDGTHPRTFIGWQANANFTRGDLVLVPANADGWDHAICLQDHATGESFDPDPAYWYYFYVPVSESIFWLRGPSGALFGEDSPFGLYTDQHPADEWVICLPEARHPNAAALPNLGLPPDDGGLSGAIERLLGLWDDTTMLSPQWDANDPFAFPRRILWRYQGEAGGDWVLLDSIVPWGHGYEPHAGLANQASDFSYNGPVYHLRSPADAPYGAVPLGDGSTAITDIRATVDLPGGLYRMNGDGDLENAGFRWILWQRSGSAWRIARTARCIGRHDDNMGYDISISPPNASERSYCLARVEGVGTSPRVRDESIWTQFRAVYTAPAAEPNTTRLWVRFPVASQSRSSLADIEVLCTRQLPVLDEVSGLWSTPQATTGLAWAVADILRNATYGAGLADADIDLAKLQLLAADWSARAWSFDASFDQAQPTWEALQQVLRAGMAKPFLVGGVPTFHMDVAQSQLFTAFSKTNIVPGSLRLESKFQLARDPDGIEASYHDPGTRSSRTISVDHQGGSNLQRPKRLELFGVTKKAQAQILARHAANVLRYRRLRLSFQAFLEGHIPIPGQLVPVSYDLPAYGQSGHIADAISSTELQADRDLDWSGSSHVLLLTRDNGSTWGPVTVTRGANDARLILPSAPDFDPTPLAAADSAGREPTRWIFGQIDQAYLEMIVEEIRPAGMDGETVEVIGVVEDARVHEGL